MIDQPWCADERFDRLAGRLAAEDHLDELLSGWTAGFDKFDLAALLTAEGVPSAPVMEPEERIDLDSRTADWGLWPTVDHSVVGPARVEGLPVHLSRSDWSLERGAPCLGEHNEYVFGELLGHSADEITRLTESGVL